MSARSTTSGDRDACEVCEHPERWHDERIRSFGNGRCSTCVVCVADAEAADLADDDERDGWGD